MKPARILVIEDDYFVARTIERSLRGAERGTFRRTRPASKLHGAMPPAPIPVEQVPHEFCITLANYGEKGLHLARQAPPDLIILDIIMPDMNGYSVCREIRADSRLANVPILFLTAKAKPEDKIAGFKAGADDYLCKPFNVDELVLRVRAILRRTKPHTAMPAIRSVEQVPAMSHSTRNLALSPACVTQGADGVDSAGYPGHSCLVVGDFALDTRSFELQTPHRGKVRLTPLQYDLLYHLMTHPGETFSPARLLDEVWDYPNGRGSPDLVRVHIKTLRERIETNPRTPAFIKTIPGRGYTVVADCNG